MFFISVFLLFITCLKNYFQKKIIHAVIFPFYFRLYCCMDAREFNTIFSTLSDKLFRMAKSILKDTDEAKDSVQELQLRLWEKRAMLSGADNKFTFTLRAMRNLCIDTLRKKQFTETLNPDIELPSLNEAHLLDTKDLANYVTLLIDKLPETQRTIIRMRDVEELEIAEIAFVTELTENAVCVNLSRARAKIRTQLLNELQPQKK